MAITWPAKDPDAVVDYAVDWSTFLDSDTIATSTFSLTTAAGLTIGSQSNSTTLSTVWLSGGTSGSTARLLCRITTAGGRTYDQAIELVIADHPEPVTLAEIKNHCRVDSTSDDDKLTSYVTAARSQIEAMTGLRLLTKTQTIYVDSFEELAFLPVAPVQSVTSISYVDTDGASQTLSTDVYEARLNDYLRPSIVLKYNQTWPTIRLGSRITVVIATGYGDRADVPTPLIHAIKMLAAYWYAMAEAASDEPTTQVPMAVDYLIENYRRFA